MMTTAAYAFWLELFVQRFYPPCPGCRYYVRYCRCEQPVHWGLA